MRNVHKITAWVLKLLQEHPTKAVSCLVPFHGVRDTGGKCFRLLIFISAQDIRFRLAYEKEKRWHTRFSTHMGRNICSRCCGLFVAVDFRLSVLLTFNTWLINNISTIQIFVQTGELEENLFLSSLCVVILCLMFRLWRSYVCVSNQYEICMFKYFASKYPTRVKLCSFDNEANGLALSEDDPIQLITRV